MKSLSKNEYLKRAKRAHRRVTEDADRVTRDAMILGARRSGATWEEITEGVDCALRTAQNAVMRAQGLDTRYK